MKKYIFILAAALTAGANLLHAQSPEHKGLLGSSLLGLDYEFKAGVNIGGTSPLPLPKEIRSLDSYSPGLAITIEGNATKWVDAAQKWGISLGVRLDSKDMTTRATVKNYGMAIFNEVGGKVEGLWTGGVKTKVKMSYITIPLLANYKINNRWKVVAGPYFSYMMDGDFSGEVYEGHLRTPDATGSFTITGKDQTGKYTTAPITIESYQMLEYEVGLSEYSFVSVGNTQYYVVSLSARWHADSWRFMSGYLQNVFIQQELIMHRQDHVQFSNIGSNGSDETYIAGYVTSIRRSGAGVVSDLKGLIPMSWIRTDMKEGSGSVQGIVGSFLIFNTEDNGFDGYYYIKQRSESFYNADEYI